MEVISGTRVSIERTPFFFASTSFTAGNAANIPFYLRMTRLPRRQRGGIQFAPFGAQGANLPWCKPLQTSVCTLTVGDACAVAPRIGFSERRTPFTWGMCPCGDHNNRQPPSQPSPPSRCASFSAVSVMVVMVVMVVTVVTVVTVVSYYLHCATDIYRHGYISTHTHLDILTHSHTKQRQK